MTCYSILYFEPQGRNILSHFTLLKTRKIPLVLTNLLAVQENPFFQHIIPKSNRNTTPAHIRGKCRVNRGKREKSVYSKTTTGNDAAVAQTFPQHILRYGQNAEHFKKLNKIRQYTYTTLVVDASLNSVV